MNRNFAITFVALPSLLASLMGGGHWGITIVTSGAAGAGGSAVNIPAAADTSLNWSGYDATGGSFTSVGASWDILESTAASSSLSADATWVGIGGVTANDLIQAGTQVVFQNGTAAYEAWYELLPATSVEVPLAVNPGDAMTVSVAETASGTWLISFSDATTGKSYATSVKYRSRSRPRSG